MRRGMIGIQFEASAEIAAPKSGVLLGTGTDGAISLRLFRAAGTRIVLAARVLPAQLIALRAAAAGSSVQVVTSRPQLWEPILGSAPRSHVVPDVQRLAPGSGPRLLIDDRPAQARGPLDLAPWQCRIDIRTQWTPLELTGFAHSDLAVFGAVPPNAARPIASTFALPRGATDRLDRLDAGSFGVVRRGRIEYVSLNPTAAEAQVLDRARGIGSAPARILG